MWLLEGISYEKGAGADINLAWWWDVVSMYSLVYSTDNLERASHYFRLQSTSADDCGFGNFEADLRFAYTPYM